MRIGELTDQADISTKAICYYEQTPCAHVTDLLQRHAADLDQRILELQQLRGELRQLAERATTLDPEHCPPERVCHIIT